MEKILFIIGLCLILCPNASLAKSSKRQPNTSFTLPSTEKIKTMSNKERQVFFHNLQQVMTRFEKDFGYAISSEFKGESAFVALKNIFVASYYKPTILKTYPLKPLPKGQFKGWASVIMTNAIL